jgi:hypothetical protein
MNTLGYTAPPNVYAYKAVSWLGLQGQERLMKLLLRLNEKNARALVYIQSYHECNGLSQAGGAMEMFFFV